MVELFGEQITIRIHLLNHAQSDEVKKAAAKICEDVGDSFCLWDTVFKAIHKEEPIPYHCAYTQDLINLAMKHRSKCMKMSIIPKLHGIEAHIYQQLLYIKGGISRLIEQWVEQYRHVGHCYDLSYCWAG